MNDEPEVTLPIAAQVIDAAVAEQVAEQVAEHVDDAHLNLERERIEAEVAIVAINADAQVEQARIAARASEDEVERWTTMETSLLWMMDLLETLEASHLLLHQRLLSLESAAAGRKERNEDRQEPREPIVEPPTLEQASESDQPEAPPEKQSTEPQRRRLIV